MEGKKITDYIKVPHFFKDVISILIGANFIFFVNYYYKPNVETIPNFKYVTDFGRLLFILFISYTIGRIIKIIADVWLDFWYLLFKDDLWKTIRSTYRDFLGIANRESYSIPMDMQDISHEVDCFIQKNSYLRNEFERKVYADAFIKGLLGLAIVVTLITLSLKFLLLVIIFTILSIIERIKKSKMRKEIAQSFTRQMAMDKIGK